ncbi:MAG TPA: CPBP family intramembrane glutamic endopeptidase [Terracidiphilus sp.]|jgi:hypothetical protein
MEPEIDPQTAETKPPDAVSPAIEMTGELPPAPEKPYQGLKWMFVGPEGLRAGWSILIFVSLMYLIGNGIGFLLSRLHLISAGSQFTARQQVFLEVIELGCLLCAAGIMALIERRRILDYNLRGPSRVKHFFSGLVVGFAALSCLVGSLAWGGWLHFGPVALHGGAAIRYAAAWGFVFLCVGCFEEGTMRCYLQFTLTRGINFWWASGLIACICAFLLLRAKGNGAVGVYVIALLGLAPCLLLELKKAPSAGFWNAAWFTSTLFGFGHTGNNGENWVGIFAAAFIGFVFCVSVWVTGSAWWAIGCHAAWDWAETYFYGTADSGFVAPGHLLTTSPAGKPLWSGGTDGPEGSLLIIPIVLLILAWLLVIYRRPHPVEVSEHASVQQLAS